MVCIGDEGFGLDGGTDTSYPFTAGEGIDWVANIKISTIDFATAHLYPESWGETDAWGVSWINIHAAAAKAAGKPFILEEYGTSTKANILVWEQAVLDSGTAADMYWQYGDTFSWGQTHNDGHSIYWGTAEFQTYVSALIFLCCSYLTNGLIGGGSCSCYGRKSCLVLGCMWWVVDILVVYIQFLLELYILFGRI